MYISNPIVNDAVKDKNYYFNAPMYLRRKKTFFNDSGDVSLEIYARRRSDNNVQSFIVKMFLKVRKNPF
jgi:hypothetical protein